MLDALSVPPRLVLRALDDLHELAEGVRRLTEHEGDLAALLHSVRTLPRVEDELSDRIDLLRAEVEALRTWLQPLHSELTDLDDTAENLERGLAQVNTTIAAFDRQLQALRDKIPGL
jgi:chromosome segregation ATPase